MLLAIERPAWIGLALAASLALVWLAIHRVTLGGHPTFLGKSYAELATDPFHPAPDNPVGHRILAPLVSYMIGFRGAYILYTNLGVVIVLIAVVFRWFRVRGHLPVWAFVGASTMALSMVSLTTLHYGGYPDSFTYLLVFGAWWARRRLWLSVLLLFLAALSHEAALFLAPWFVAELARDGNPAPRGWLRATAGVAVATIAFAGVRVLMERAHPSVEYSVGFYLRPLLHDPLHWFRPSAPHRLLGIAAAFNLYWVFLFLAAARLARDGERAAALRLLLPIPLALAQLLMGHDVTRYATMAFPSVLIGCEDLLRTDAFRVRRWALLLGVANFFIPQVNVAMGIVDRMGPK